MNKFIISLMAISSLFLVSCHEDHHKVEEKNLDKKIKIVTSISPIASIANYIGGDEVSVYSIVKPGTSPHFFEAKPSDFIKVNEADLVFKIGLEFDTFTDKLTSDKEKIVLADFAKLVEGEEHHHDHGEEGHEHDAHEEEHHEEHEGHDNEEGEHHDEDEHHEDEEAHEEHKGEEVFYDPHLWLSKENALAFANVIKGKLGTLKADKKDTFEANYKDFEAKINKIYANFEEKTKDKEERGFIIFHNAYSYLFHDLGIHDEDFAVLEGTVGKEPSAKELKEIIDTIKEKNIKVIYKEPQMDAKLVETLAEDYNLEVSTLNPLSSSDSKEDYLKNLESNLNNLLLRYE